MIPADYVVIGVILGLMAALLAAWYDGWMNPQDYSHLEEK